MNRPLVGNAHMVGSWVGREQVPAINAKPYADVIEKQHVIACSVPVSRENYHAPVLFLALWGIVGYADSSVPLIRSEQVFLAKVGISRRSA